MSNGQLERGTDHSGLGEEQESVVCQLSEILETVVLLGIEFLRVIARLAFLVVEAELNRERKNQLKGGLSKKVFYCSTHLWRFAECLDHWLVIAVDLERVN